jgi:homoserine O-succinyltransferase
MFNHLEYEADTLKLEYLRDCMRRPGVTVPRNYLPNGDVSQTPAHVWRRPAEVLFANWRSLLLARACAGGGVKSSAA